MTLRINFLIVLRVHLIVMAVQSGGLFEIDHLNPPTSHLTWFSEEVSIAGTAPEIRGEVLFANVSASSHAQQAL